METSDPLPDSAERVTHTVWDRLATLGPPLRAAGASFLRSNLVRGFGPWIVVITLAYLVGTLAIAPMIGEAAGLRPSVYALSDADRNSISVREPVVVIAPVSSMRSIAAAGTPARAEGEKAKPRRKRRRRHRTQLPPDEVYIGRANRGDPANDTAGKSTGDEATREGTGNGGTGFGEGGEE